MPLLALSLLKRFWPVLVGVLAVLALIWWHNNKVDAAYERGKTEQATTDAKAYTEAAIAAADAQQAIIDGLKARSTKINEKVTHDHQKRDAAIARGYDDLRRMWAAYKANSGGPAAGEASAVPGTASEPDAAYCEARGWVSLDVAATAAEAADRAIAKDDAWIAWAEATRAAWPK